MQVLIYAHVFTVLKTRCKDDPHLKKFIVKNVFNSPGGFENLNLLVMLLLS